jgi:hypothetical protein
LVRAPALQAGCRGFESLTAHHETESNTYPSALPMKSYGQRVSTASPFIYAIERYAIPG